MKKITFLIALMLLVVTGSYAQANAFSFAQSNETYTPITGGTVVVTSTDAVPSRDSYASAALTLPVAFNFGGTSFTTFYVTSNGQVQLGGTSAPSTTNYRVLNNDTGSNVFLAPFSADLNVGATGVANIRWEQVGDEIVIQWTNFRRFGKAESFNFQVRLNTVTRVVKYVYDGTPPFAVTTDYQPQVGIKTASGNYLGLTVAAAGSWNTPVQIITGMTDSSIATFNGPIGFTSGLTYTFTPPAACTGTPVAGVVTGALTRNICSGSAPGVINVTGTTPLGVFGIGYQWEQSTNGTDWANVVGGTGAATLSYTPPSYAGTPIQYRLKVTCANGNGTAYSDVLSVANQISPATQATALTVTPANTSLSSFVATWTNGNGMRRQVYVSTTAIVDPAGGTAIPAYTANAAFANTGQQLVYDGTGTTVTVTGLTCNTPYFVKVVEYNRCGSGPYDIYFNVTTGTNVLTVTTTAPATAVLPATNNFTGFTGANLSTAVPGWYEAVGTTNVSLIPVLGNSDWVSSTALITPTAKVNLYDDAFNAWIISPKMAITANSRLKFKAAITNYNNGNADPEKMAGTDDKVNILVSTDGCGAVWTVIHTFNAANTTTLTNVLTDFTLPLNYAGQTIQIAFQGVDGPVDNVPDYDFHIGNIVIEQTPQCDVPAMAATTNITKNSATISWTAPTVGTPTGYQYVVSTTSTAPTGAGTGTAGTSVNVTPLLPATQYYVYVRTVCGTDFSDWSVVQTFTTLCNYPDITSTTGGSVCGQGTATLQAASAPGAVLKWYAGTTGDTTLGTGTSFTTPVITATTNYYVSGGQPAAGSTVIVGAGATTTDTYSNPLYSAWSNNHTQHIITATELQNAGLSAGNINSVSLNVTAAGTLPMIGLNIKIGTTTATSMEAFVANGAFSTVFTSASYMPTTGVNTFTFTTPFNWDGTSNIVVEFCHGNSASSATMSRTVTADVTSYVSSVKRHFSTATASTDACGATTGGTLASYSLRPQFYFNGVGLCMSPRVAVAATVTTPPAITLSGNPAPICSGQATTAVTVTAGAASYDTFVWAPTTGVSGNATTGWIFNPTATTAYTLTASNTVSGCAIAVPVNVTVKALPSAVTISPDPLAVCEGSTSPIVVQNAIVNVDAIIGTGTTAPGTTTLPNPFTAWYGGAKTQILFKASELTAQGLLPNTNITALAFDFFATTAAECNDLTIRIGNTTVPNMTAGMVPSTSFTTVYNADFTPSATGYVPFVLSTPFMWTGSDIIVEVVHNAGNAGNGVGTRTRTTTTAYDSVYIGLKDNVTPAGAASISALTMVDFTTGTSTNAISTSRPNVRFSQNVNNTVSWAPVTNLFTDAAATIPYTGQSIATVYTKPTAAITYVATVTNTDGCSITADVAVTVSITPAPTAVAAQTFCGGTVATLVATGTGIKWYTVATGGTALATTTALVNGTIYYASQTIAGCESLARTAVTATVNTTAAPTGTAAQTFCNAATVANLTATGTGIQWYAAETGGTALAPTTALVNGTIYYASQTLASCESTARFAVTATVNVTAVPTGAATQTFCNLGTVANLTATGTGIQWYAAATGGTALAPTTALVNGSVYHASQTIAGCESATRLAVTVTIAPVAAPTGNANQTFCNTATVAGLTATGTDIQWYAAATGGTALAPATPLVNGITYYASQTLTACESATRFAVTVAITVTPAPTGTATQVFCNEGTVADLSATGTGIQWYADATGGTALTPETDLVNGTIYYASQTVATCESATRFAVTANIGIVLPPTGTATQIFCNEGTVAGLTATGSGVQWYADATGGSPLVSTAALVNGTIYYASQTVSGCESATRLAVTAQVNVIAAPTGNDAQAFCNAATVADLSASGEGILWYADATGGTALSGDTALVSGNVYYASQTIDGCESLTRFAVTAGISVVDAPAGVSPQEIAANPITDATIEDIVITDDGGTITWYASEEDALAGINPLASDTQIVNGTYYATQTVGACTSATALAIEVSVVLSNKEFDVRSFTYYPNPVKDVLTLSYSSNIESVTVYNMLGQPVISQSVNALKGNVDMSNLADGTYMINVTMGDIVKTVQIIKKQ